jgi:hypothetical protein
VVDSTTSFDEAVMGGCWSVLPPLDVCLAEEEVEETSRLGEGTVKKPLIRLLWFEVSGDDDPSKIVIGGSSVYFSSDVDVDVNADIICTGGDEAS